MCARARYTHIGYIAKFQFFHIRKILEKGNLRKKWKIIYEKILEMRNERKKWNERKKMERADPRPPGTFFHTPPHRLHFPMQHSRPRFSPGGAVQIVPHR